MSHLVTIRKSYLNEEILEKAFDKFGWKLIRNENEKITIHTYGDTSSKRFDIRAKNPLSGGYDIGINKLVTEEENTEYRFTCDLYGGSIEKTLGSKLKDFDKEYQYLTIEDKAASEHEYYSITRETDALGRDIVRLEVQDA